MEPEIVQREILSAKSVDMTSASRQQLIAFIAENTAPLLGTLRSYVQRMGLASGDDVAPVAVEVLQETVVEALGHAERFDPTRQPMAWLLGIALNVMKRKKVERAKRSQRELSITHFSARQAEPVSDDELFDGLINHVPTLNHDATLAGPEQKFEADEQARAILALVSPDDQQVLRLAFLLDFERKALAQRLGITTVAARVRLHRALSRLRAAWHAQQAADAQPGERGQSEPLASPDPQHDNPSRQSQGTNRRRGAHHE
jgi:RNA polymerase sigma factor (sigma-70 family)